MWLNDSHSLVEISRVWSLGLQTLVGRDRSLAQRIHRSIMLVGFPIKYGTSMALCVEAATSGWWT